ncbi:LacI family transcriptional regulator [Noviherbaspirillum denitrificans]|uniref:LacI family transcriptional regulator n=1 Tax=Noviherbaspirillum denitrificans TaxID=1968433 RepID=A0A254TNL9_9BURK|nr:LacI family transcriptional regulator [Noviherbaspirillum denitrificans]
MTIRDVAAHAAVNPSTVSRALNPATRHLIGDEVVKRVLASAKALGYRPNALASALSGGSSKVVGVLLPDIENPVFPPIIRGIEEQLAAEGFSVLIANLVVGSSEQEQEQALEQMLSRQVDGLILATAAREDPLVRRCILEDIPVVLVNRGEQDGRVPEVVNDDILSMKLAVDHLIDLGHASIAHVSGPLTLATGHSRHQGFLIAARQHGLADTPIVEATEFTREAGRIACGKLLKRHKGVTAIVAANDLIALGCYDALQAANLRCPEDVSIIGHNDMPLVDMLNPPLSTIRIQHREMGKQGARLLLDRIQKRDGAIVRITLPPKLMARGSTCQVAKPADRAPARKKAMERGPAT